MKNKILTLILLASALCPGCSGWLDVKPYDQISEEELLESEEGFQKLLNGIYIELNSDELYGSTLSVEMIEILGGAYEIGDNSSVWGDYLDLKDYDYNTDYWRGRLNGTWNKAYALILNCNKLLKNIQGRQALFTGHNYDIIRGEALALRAMLHFDMLRLFGPVYSLNPDGTSIPYYADETLTPEALLPASQVVYKVLQDLMAARAALLNDPVITEGTLMSSAGNGSNFLRYRALRLNYYAVSALLARVNLYAGQKQDALTYAVEVIRASNNGIFPFVDRSLVVGKPAAMMLDRENATVTICNSRTQNLPAICKEADVVVVAMGKMGAVGADCLREGQTVVDVGIHVNEEGKLCGDVKFAEAEPIVDAITPVPGGVGTVTTSVLVGHVVQAAAKKIGL